MVDVKYRAGVWQTLIDVLQAQKPWVNQIADDFGITPQTAKALHLLPLRGSLTMKELASDMWCDQSNVTGVIDRLEARGLVERRPSEADRRVKCVLLTVAGKRLRRKLDERFSESPPAIAALSDADKKTLREILERTLEHAAKLRGERAD
jgi:DNA-binding MarR family transcriptional regulator